MPKAETKSRRVRATRKGASKPAVPKLPAPFSLNREGRAALKVHARHEAAQQAAQAALDAEGDDALVLKPKRRRQEGDFSPATCALRDKWHASMRETSAYMGALAERIAARKVRTAADAVTLLIAGLHSGAARHPLSEALDSALGLGLTRASS